MSRPPSAFAASSIERFTAAGSALSAWMATALRPFSSMARTTSAARSARAVVGNRHIRALFGQRQRDRGADAARCARDEGALSSQFTHGFSFRVERYRIS